MASHGRIIDPAQNVATGNAYNGINVLALWATAQDRAYTHSLWGTYREFQSLDAQVRKGEKAALVIFYKEYDDGRASPVFRRKRQKPRVNAGHWRRKQVSTRHGKSGHDHRMSYLSSRKKKLALWLGTVLGVETYLADRIDYVRKVLSAPTTIRGLLHMVASVFTSTSTTEWIILSATVACFLAATYDQWHRWWVAITHALSDRAVDHQHDDHVPPVHYNRARIERMQAAVKNVCREWAKFPHGILEAERTILDRALKDAADEFTVDSQFGHLVRDILAESGIMVALASAQFAKMYGVENQYERLSEHNQKLQKAGFDLIEKTKPHVIYDNPETSPPANAAPSVRPDQDNRR